MSRFLTISLFIALLLPVQLFAAEQVPSEQQMRESVDNLKEPLYTPFIERYVLDELKQLRTDMAAQRAEMIQMTVDKELSAADRAVGYATDTVTYFFLSYCCSLISFSAGGLVIYS